jgi:hypothetical protein
MRWNENEDQVKQAMLKFAQREDNEIPWSLLSQSSDSKLESFCEMQSRLSKLHDQIQFRRNLLL